MCVPLPLASAFWIVCDSDLDRLNENIYNKITTVAKDLVAAGKAD